MSLLRYLKQKDGLPDPKASLTSKVPTLAIVHESQPGSRSGTGRAKEETWSLQKVTRTAS